MPIKLLIAFAFFLTVRFTFAAELLRITVWEPGLGSAALDINAYTIQLEGTIDAAAPVRLQAHLQRLKNKTIVFYFNSPGGNLIAGMEIGRMVRETGIAASIGRYQGEEVSSEPGSCYSACALSFLGGIYRYIDRHSKYGVHRFSKPKATDQDLDAAQIVSAEVARYIREMDVYPALFDLMVRASKDQIYVLNPKQLTDLNVVNDGKLRPRWTIEAMEGAMYLRGQQETVWGNGRAMFVCEKGVVMNSIAPVGEEKAASMVRGEWLHSLLVDDDVVSLGSPIGLNSKDGYLNALFLLTPQQVQRILSAKKVGHAIQMSREDPAFVGYTIEIPVEARQRVSTFIRSCTKRG